MAKFPVDAPKLKVIKALESLGFRIVREKLIKGSTLRSICTQAGISRDEFMTIYETL